MKVKKQLVLRKIVSDYILVPTGDTVLESNGLFALSEVGAFIWEQITKGKEKDEILLLILDEFDTDEQTARQDLDEFIDRLKEMNIL